MKKQDTIKDSIHETSTLFRDVAIIFGIIVGALTFVATRPELSAVASDVAKLKTSHDSDIREVKSILKTILTLQCRSARVNDKLTAKDVDEFCKQL